MRNTIKNILEGDQTSIRAAIRQRIYSLTVVDRFQKAHERLEAITEQWQLLQQLQALYGGTIQMNETELVMQYKRMVRHPNLVMLQNQIRPHRDKFQDMCTDANTILSEEIQPERRAAELAAQEAINPDAHIAMAARGASPKRDQ